MVSEENGAALSWKKDYEAALMEFDKTKLPRRIRHAQQVIADRLRELAKSARMEERLQVQEALNALWGLQRLCEQCELHNCQPRPLTGRGRPSR